MPYSAFEELSKREENELGLSQLSVDEIEKLYWDRICLQRKYAINNNMSLFGDNTTIWNLDKFTNAESNIHSTQTHHELNVSKMNSCNFRWFEIIFIRLIFLTGCLRWDTIALHIFWGSTNVIRIPFRGWKFKFC